MLWHSSKAQGYFFHYSGEKHRRDSVFVFFFLHWTTKGQNLNAELVTSLRCVQEQSLTKLCSSRSMQQTDYRGKERQKEISKMKRKEKMCDEPRKVKIDKWSFFLLMKSSYEVQEMSQRQWRYSCDKGRGLHLLFMKVWISSSYH